jgi:glycosyltransferase involved in cell wall biosynthesis
MKVLHVLEATLGGTLRYLENIVAAMEGTDIECALAYGTSRADPRLAPLLQRARDLCWRLFPMDMRREISLTREISCLWQLRRSIRRFNPDIVHCHSSKAGALGRLAASTVWPRPLRVYSPHAIAAPLGKRYLTIEKLLTGVTDHFAAVSHGERLELAGFGLAEEEAISVISPTIDLSFFRPRPRDEARAQLGLGPEPFVLAIGRLTPQKDPNGFLEVIRALKRLVPHAQAIWLGDGEQRGEFMEKARKHNLDRSVRVVGWQHDVRPWLAASNVLLSSSRFESFGYMVAEALAMGIPVVATDVTGSREILRGQLAVGLYHRGSYEAGAQRIAAMLGEEGEQCGQLGRREIEERFNPRVMRSALLECYRMLQHQRDSRPRGFRSRLGSACAGSET